jgi:hypothetical protein
MLSGKMRVVLVITLAVIFTFSLHSAKFFEDFPFDIPEGVE